ncbi:two-component response regulator [Deferribacter desulfuricans SSM1]|uniref:Two-component response regulator n=1 Tax=Deferribacter desulfuricans (strain DSM 14783 / JCM 11476 / NBRC 101012 / SSM1) TaxID=639282 RepID=D3PE23_DEFDS|nr:response regulator [Deferribacter desulfuricans]BAI80846.1 two-component response regulator [Deferribacter desulfuricans SSM1]
MNKILILDDDEQLLGNLKELFEDNDFTVFTCSDPGKALEILEYESPKILLVDYLMPQIDGINFIKKIRETDKLIRIILMTAFPTYDLAVDAIKNGANDFVSKPFKFEELMVKIMKSLEELKFVNKECMGNEVDDILYCLSNNIRRNIVQLLIKEKRMKFMEIVRNLDFEDHTKLNFHLKILLKNNLIVKNDGYYLMTEYGLKVFKCINNLFK